MSGGTAIRVGAAVLVATVAVGCGGDDGAQPGQSTSTTATTSVAADALPPAGALDLAHLYEAPLAELGLRLTDRGGLIDRSDGGYEPSAAGDHLALYVEPIADRTTGEYVDGILDVAVVFADVFDRWPGLASYDVCQEPVDLDDTQGPEPLPVTQIELTRQQAADIDWATASVVDLVRAARAEPPGMTLRVNSVLSADPGFGAITAEALSSG